jgi:hypothetical protein
MPVTTSHKLYISLGVLAALAGALYYQNRQQRQEEASYSAVTRAAELPKLALSEKDTKQIDKIIINKPPGDAGKATEVVLEKQEDEWKLVKPIEHKANKNNVESLLKSLERLEVKEEVASGTDHYGEFGVSEKLALHAVFHKGKEVLVDLYFGEGGSRGQMTRIAGRDGVYAVQGYASYAFGREVKDWRDKSVFKFDEKKVTRIELVNESGSYVFDREAKPADKKDGKDEADDKDKQDKKDKKDDKDYTWVGTLKGEKAPVAKPIERFDAKKVDDLLRAFKSLNADGFGDDKSPSDVGLDEPVGRLTIFLEDGAKRELIVGAKAEGSSRWVKTADSDQLFSIGSWPANWATSEPKKFQKPEDKDKDEDD